MHLTNTGVNIRPHPIVSVRTSAVMYSHHQFLAISWLNRTSDLSAYS